MCDRPLGESFDDVESELIGFRVEKCVEEPRPSSEDKPWVSKHYALFVTDVRELTFRVSFMFRNLKRWKRAL